MVTRLSGGIICQLLLAQTTFARKPPRPTSLHICKQPIAPVVQKNHMLTTWYGRCGVTLILLLGVWSGRTAATRTRDLERTAFVLHLQASNPSYPEQDMPKWLPVHKPGEHFVSRWPTQRGSLASR